MKLPQSKLRDKVGEKLNFRFIIEYRWLSAVGKKILSSIIRKKSAAFCFFQDAILTALIVLTPTL